MSLALVYLARGKDNGILSVRAFFDAYRTFPPGCPHDLIVIAKGWADEAEENEMRTVAQAHGARIIDLPDDGFDWGAYARLAPQLSHDWVCFFNTHSRPLVKGWLDFLWKAANTPGMNIGAVGATASYQSLFLSSIWPSNKDGLLDLLLYPFRLMVGVFCFFTTHLYDFRPFPNRHLRSNAFIVRRDLFIDFVKNHKNPSCKRDAWIMESGRTGFTDFIVARSLKVLVAGADGKYYEPQQWINSGTFWVPGQPNLLVADNQTRAYDNGDKKHKRNLEKAGWGKKFS